MSSRIFHTRSEEETIALGRQLSTELANSVVLLIGNLGAGKTTLAKGIVEGRNGTPANEVSSPTFTLIHHYGDAGRRSVYHIDLYRLDEVRDVERLGLDDLFARCDAEDPSLVLLEWAERFPALLPRQRTEIRLQTLPDDSREIIMTWVDEQAEGELALGPRSQSG